MKEISLERKRRLNIGIDQLQEQLTGMMKKKMRTIPMMINIKKNLRKKLKATSSMMKVGIMMNRKNQNSLNMKNQ